MSRCFPFPPPGYEKKPRPDDDDLLKKEKLKEKKHKEKKDKEKKEGKEKREKERSDGKHREKKDKKEKHKDKKKDKEKDREKQQDKGSTTEEKRVSGKLEDYNGAKLHRREKERGKEVCSTSEDRRHTWKFEGCNGEKLHDRVEHGGEKRNVSDEKKPVVQFQDHSGGKSFQNSLLDKDSEDSKFVLELDRRVRDEGKGTGSQLVEGFMGMDWKKDEGIERLAVGGTSMAVESKEKNKDKRVDIRKMDGQRTGHEASFNGNAMAQNLAGSIQNKVGVPKPMEKIDQWMEGKGKEREVEDKQGDMRKSKDKEAQSQGKDKNREKEKKKEDKAKEKKGHKKSDKDKTKSSNKSDLNGTLDKTSHLSKDGDKKAAMEGTLKKRKDMEKNGFLHDDAFRLEKMPKLTSHLLENGKKLEPSQTPTPFSPHRQGTAYNPKVDDKDHKINGLIGAEKLPISAPKPSTVIAEASRRPPHPDIKYLSKVLSVPQMDKWSGFDDQEWLFDSKGSLLKKSQMVSVRVPEQHVWAEALHMDSADVYALPYVIPY